MAYDKLSIPKTPMLDTLFAAAIFAHPHVASVEEHCVPIDHFATLGAASGTSTESSPPIEAQGPPPTASIATEVEPPTSRSKVNPALTAGVLEAFALAPGAPHLGFFVTLALDLQIPVNDNWTLIPSFGVEFAPDVANWGGTFFFIVDRVLVSKPSITVTLEPQLGVYQNAVPRAGTFGFDHNFYLSPGLGTALIFERFAVLPTMYTSWGLQRDGWSLGPSLMFSVPI